MILFIYFFLRILLLFALNIGSDTVYSQDTTPVKTPVADSVVLEAPKEVELVLDSTLKAIEELKSVPRNSDIIIKRSKKLSRKLDQIYYNSILPIKMVNSRPLVPTAVLMKSPPVMMLDTEYRCLDLKVTIPVPERREPWIKRINPFRKRK